MGGTGEIRNGTEIMLFYILMESLLHMLVESMSYLRHEFVTVLYFNE